MFRVFVLGSDVDQILPQIFDHVGTRRHGFWCRGLFYDPERALKCLNRAVSARLCFNMDLSRQEYPALLV